MDIDKAVNNPEIDNILKKKIIRICMPSKHIPILLILSTTYMAGLFFCLKVIMPRQQHC